MKAAIYNVWVWLFARARFARLNRFLYSVSLRGLGVLNYASLRESGERNFLEKIFALYRPGGGPRCVVLDVGANVGHYSREILRLAKAAEVYCFEPHPANVGKLRTAVEPMATVVPCAVGSEVGSLELFDYADEDGSSHASVYKDVFEKIHKRPHTCHTVDVVTLDGFLEARDIDHVTLLKIDTEGHELAALMGASKALSNGSIDVIHFEFNEMNIASRTFLGDFFEILPDYRLFRLLRDGWVPLSGRPLDNVFAYQNIVAVRNGSPAQALFA
jgi:FkbM family methyltransferase